MFTADDLERLAPVLGDNTRRRIFFHVLDKGVGVTAAEVAETFGVHRTVARLHLEKLVQHAALERRSVRTGQSGRPSAVYSAQTEYSSGAAGATGTTTAMPPGADGWQALAAALSRSLACLGREALELVVEAGERDGLRAGENDGLKAIEIGNLQAGFEPVNATADGGRRLREGSENTALSAAIESRLLRHGRPFRATWQPDSQVLRLSSSCCPFKDAALLHPDIVCGYDLAFIRGLISAVAADNGVSAVLVEKSGAEGARNGASALDAMCNLTVTLSSDKK